MRETVQDPTDEMEADLVRVANARLHDLDTYRHYRAQKKIGKVPIEVPPEENQGERRDTEVIHVASSTPSRVAEPAIT